MLQVFSNLLDFTLIILVMINPVAKISVISFLSKGHTDAQMRNLTVKSNIIGFLLCALFAVFGTFILSYVFHIQVDALRVAGGFALFFMGFEYLWKGEVRVISRMKELDELAAAPMGTPLIAGPATITTVITLSSTDAIPVVLAASFLAILLNLAMMLWSIKLVHKLNKSVISGLIRIMGLFVMSIGAQMMLAGVKAYFHL